MTPLISVIVPVYNVSKYVEKCLSSLCQQTMKEIEIIVVDDCGADDSVEIVQRIAKNDNRIKVIHNKTNQGLAESRNVGLKYVRSPYVAFLDSDDWISNDFYEKLYSAIQIDKSDIAIADVIYYYNENKQTHEWVSNWNFTTNKKIVISPEEKQYNIYACACWNKLYKIDLFKKYHLQFPKGLYIEDVPITFVTTMLANKISLVSDAKLYYRMRNDSIMGKSKTDRKPFDIFKIYDYIDVLYNKHKNFDPDGKFQQILDNFKIFNIYAWYVATHTIYKDEFWKKMKKVFMKIDIKNNPFINQETHDKYSLVCFNKKIIEVVYIRLFDLFPLFKYKKVGKLSHVYLFGIIPFIYGKDKNR